MVGRVSMVRVLDKKAAAEEGVRGGRGSSQELYKVL